MHFFHTFSGLKMRWRTKNEKCEVWLLVWVSEWVDIWQNFIWKRILVPCCYVYICTTAIHKLCNAQCAYIIYIYVSGYNHKHPAFILFHFSGIWDYSPFLLIKPFSRMLLQNDFSSFFDWIRWISHVDWSPLMAVSPLPNPRRPGGQPRIVKLHKIFFE